MIFINQLNRSHYYNVNLINGSHMGVDDEKSLILLIFQILTN